MYNNIKDKMERLAIVLSDTLSSITMFWIISFLVLVPLFFTQPKGLVGWMQYIVSVFFQGVALPVLAYTSKMSGKQTDMVIKKIEDLSEKIERKTEEIDSEVDHMCEEMDQIKDKR